MNNNNYRRYIQTPLALTLLALLVACSEPQTDQATIAAKAKTPKTEAIDEYGAWGVDLAARDTSVKPGDDFFRYVNGTWLDTHEIPAERTSMSVSLITHERAQKRVKGIIEELAEKGGAEGTPEQKVGDYYASWMDEDTANKMGITPLQPDLDRIAAIANVDDLAGEFGRQYYVSGASVFSAGLGFDPKNPDKWNINIGLKGMSLPDRDYYLEESERFLKIRAAYLKHLAQMLEFSGEKDTLKKAENILALETEIAKLQWKREDRRDRDKTYNVASVASVIKDYPGFNWPAFLTAANLKDLKEVNLNHPNTIAPLIKLINSTPLDTWKAYLTYNMISNNGRFLSHDIDAANFDFWGKIIYGQEKRLQRWKRGVSLVSAKTGLGEAIGQIYVDRYFDKNSKELVEAMVENLRTAYGERIDQITWMSDDTKKEARAKLAAFRAKIGYPDKWLDLDAIKINKKELFANSRRIKKFFEDRDSNRVSQPTDREEWLMMPQTVNAYYLSSFNEIVFPAAILTAPEFDANADPAVNYGAIGAVIGHEMGHGFDDQGSKSDAKGIKRNWWTDADRAAFEARTAKLGEQFSQYEPVPGNFVDGKFTMGENIGDLGGVEVALRAYQISLDGKESPVIDGFTGTQRFFLAYGQGWRGKLRQERALQLLKSDPHSPNKFRVNGIVKNVDAWYEAFNVKPGDALYLAPEDRVSIW